MERRWREGGKRERDYDNGTYYVGDYTIKGKGYSLQHFKDCLSHTILMLLPTIIFHRETLLLISLSTLRRFSRLSSFPLYMVKVQWRLIAR